VLVLAVVVLFAWLRVRSDEATISEITRELRPSIGSDAPPVPEPLLLDLDVSWAYVIVKPGEEGQPLGLFATYDADRFLLEVTPEDEVGRDNVLGVRFVPMGSKTIAALRPMVGGTLPRMEIHVPPGIPVGIRAKFDGGHALFELGELWLTDVDLAIDRGLMQVQFRGPTAWPVESMDLSCRGGNLVLYNIGHASPRRLTVHQGMGPGFFDLAGDWRTDSEVQVTVAFGTGHLRIPEGVGVRGLEGEFERFNRAAPADGTELGPPVLDMNAHYDAGLIQVSVVPAE